MTEINETDWPSEDDRGPGPRFLTESFVTIEASGGELVFKRHGAHDGEAGLEMARFTGDTLRIFPKQGSDVGHESAYGRFCEIQLEWDDTPPELELSFRSGPYLGGLPDGLGTSFRYGLNFPIRFRCLATTIQEKTSCTILRLTNEEIVRIQGETLSVGFGRFRRLIDEININYRRADAILARIRKAAAGNLIAEGRGEATQHPSRGRIPAIQKMTDAIRDNVQLDEEEVIDLVDIFIRQANETVKKQPRVANRLRNDLNLVTLEVLLAQYRADLGDKTNAKNENHWQRFFERNPFALQQLFGAPVVNVSEIQLQVGSPKSDRKGARITDFLLANSLTGEGLVVEIKTPAASLVEVTPYRGDGSSAVYRPHSDLTGAVAQLQSQKESLRDKLREKLPYDDPLNALNHAAPRGALIVGQVGTLEGSALDSFRRYRDGLHDVVLVGFDEVAGRLQALLDLIREPDAAPSRAPVGA